MNLPFWEASLLAVIVMGACTIFIMLLGILHEWVTDKGHEEVIGKICALLLAFGILLSLFMYPGPNFS